MAALQAKSGGVWKEAEPWVKSGGVWVKPTEVYAKSGGVWKKVWPAVSSLTYVTSVSVNSKNITIPATANVGDLLVLFDAPADSATPPSFLIPADFTLIDNLAVSTAIRSAISYKIAVSGDPGKSISGMTSGGTNRKIMAVFRPDIGITSVSVLGLSSASKTANASANQTITSGSGPEPLIALGSERSGATTLTVDGTLASAGSALTTLSAVAHTAYYKIMNTAPTDLTWGFTGTGITNIGLQSFYLAVN